MESEDGWSREVKEAWCLSTQAEREKCLKYCCELKSEQHTASVERQRRKSHWRQAQERTVREGCIVVPLLRNCPDHLDGPGKTHFVGTFWEQHRWKDVSGGRANSLCLASLWPWINCCPVASASDSLSIPEAVSTLSAWTGWGQWLSRLLLSFSYQIRTAEVPSIVDWAAPGRSSPQWETAPVGPLPRHPVLSNSPILSSQVWFCSCSYFKAAFINSLNNIFIPLVLFL
jgi:hypothetical protein